MLRTGVILEFVAVKKPREACEIVENFTNKNFLYIENGKFYRMGDSLLTSLHISYYEPPVRKTGEKVCWDVFKVKI